MEDRPNVPSPKLRRAHSSLARVSGRVTYITDGKGKLDVGRDSIDFFLECDLGFRLEAGDIATIEGYLDDGLLVAEDVALHVSPRSASWKSSGDWNRFHRDHGMRARNLEVRERAIRAIRAHFSELGFMEVETPILLPAPGHERHIEPFSMVDNRGRVRFLQTSPEHYMKRLLGGGFERIFQLCRCFRRGESTSAHAPEFTMLEWYRTYASCEDIMEEAEGLVTEVTRRVLGCTGIDYQGAQIDLDVPWERIAVREAFSRFAGIDLAACDDVGNFLGRVRAAGVFSEEGDSWEDLFTRVLLERIEPALASMGPVFLVDYPAKLAALAKLKETDRGIAERVELYVGGLELANGYTELNDAAEQRQRFAHSQEERRRAGAPIYPLDEDFLRMADEGMPPAAGIALGVDRLLMLLTNATDIEQVVAFPTEAA